MAAGRRLRHLSVARPPVFVDTNVLVYAHNTDEAEKCPVAQQVLDGLWRTGDGVLSVQVLQEFYVTMTKKGKPSVTSAEARELLATYCAWPVVAPDEALVLAATELHERHSVSFWDALIIEAAKRAGATRLVSEDLQHGQNFDGVVVENPFGAIG